MKLDGVMKKFIVFVAIAILVAFVLVTGVKSLTDIMKSVWTFAVETDKGYMWIINIAVSAVIAFVFTQGKSKAANFFAIVGFLVTMIVSECFLWHRAEIWTIISANTFQTERLTNVGLGVLASAIAYIIAEKISK